ncbi:MAG: hypothetical protein OHK0048_11210 [Rhodoferax sp.]
MFVSILQLMGFPLGKPVHSPPKERPAKGIEPTDAPAARAVPRAEPAALKPATPSPSRRRAPLNAKAAQPPTSALADEGRASKPKSALSQAKARASSTKDAAEAGARAQARKSAAKAASTPVPEPAPALTAKPKAPAKRAASVKAAPKPAEAAPNQAAKAPDPNTDLPVRSSRPSARLVQLTVPSMAQTVASTAAKSSFTSIQPVQTTVSSTASVLKKNPALSNHWKTKPVAELTDEEVLAMPDDAYMNDTQMAFFRLRLQRLKEEILNNAGETTEHLRDDTVVVPDPADRATIEEEHALELRTRDRERKLLKKIEQAIARIDAGDYGYCEETGEPIGIARLLARPTASLSLEAQQRRELKQKMFGD